MESWKNLKESEQKLVEANYRVFLKGLKDLIVNSNIFTYDTREDNSISNEYFKGLNVNISWRLFLDSIEIAITKVQKKETKSLWNKKIEEIVVGQFYLHPFGQKKYSFDWDFDDYFDDMNSSFIRLTEEERRFVNLIYEYLNETISKTISENNQFKLEKTEQLKKEKEQLNVSKKTIIQKLDTDNNGEIDLIENDFPKLLSKYQKQIISIDKNYIHQFVKMSNYIGAKKNNIQQIFKSIEKINSKTDLEKRINLIKNQRHTYDLLIFHSLNMIEALVSEDLITFYEIYEKFDKIGIYNSNWENEVSNKLTTIGSNLSSLGNKLDALLSSIEKMEQNIVSEIGYMNYSTQESFGELNDSLTSSLKSINSSIDVNNLFTAINTYQLYKINKQTKPLLPKNK